MYVFAHIIYIYTYICINYVHMCIIYTNVHIHSSTHVDTELVDTILSTFHILTWYNSHNLPRKKPSKDSTPSSFKTVWLV